MLAVVAPTKRELGGLPLGVHESVLVSVTGIGHDPTLTSMQSLLQHPSLVGVVSVGFGGGLDPELRTADLVVCNQTIAQDSSTGSWSSYEADRSLMEVATHALAGISVRVSPLLTVKKAFLLPREKDQAFQVTGAAVVDMEGHWMAMECHRAGLPFLALRAILDPAQEELPALVQKVVEANGDGAALKATVYLVRRPWKVFRLTHLWREARQAQRSLREATDILLPSFIEASATVEP